MMKTPVRGRLTLSPCDSSERTVLSQGLMPLLTHLFQFPLDILIDLLPASLLLFFLIRKDLFSLLQKNELIAFSAVIFLANIPVYWLSPGARQRYIYMLYPLLIMVLTYGYLHREALAPWRFITFRIIIGTIISLVMLGAISLNFIPDLQFLDYLLPLSIIVAIGAALCLYFYVKNPDWSLAILLLVLGISRIVFDLTILPQRALQSGAAQDQSYALTIDSLVGSEDLYVFKNSRFSFTTAVYLNKLRKTTLKRDSSYLPNAYYLSNDTLLSPNTYDSFFQFDFRGQQFSLVKFQKE